MRVALLLIACACGAPAPPQVAEPSLDEIESAPGFGTLEGVVVDVASDRPVSFAQVSVYRESDGELAGETTTNQAGRYEVPNLPPGSYRVVVEFSNLRSESRGITLMADAPTPLRVQLSSHAPVDGRERQRTLAGAGDLGTIEGVVVDGVRGEPLGGATVEVSAEHLVDPVFTIADEGGRFRIPALPPGTYLVSVYYSLVDKGNIEIRRSGVVVDRGTVTQLTLELDTKVR